MEEAPSSKVFFTEILHQHYKSLVKQAWRFDHRESNDHVALIVEPRCHDMLAYVCANVMWHLGGGWNLHIVTGRGKREWVQKAVLEPLNQSTAMVTELNVNNLSVPDYSALLMSARFWRDIRESHVLLFQTDCIMFCGGINGFVDMGLEYVGANYFNPRDIAPRIGGIQGGFSLRSRVAMLDCIQRVSQQDVNAYRVEMGCAPLSLPMAEDVYFTHACEMLGKRVLAVKDRKYFSIEAEWFEAPIAFHGWVHDYFDHERNKKLVGYM